MRIVLYNSKANRIKKDNILLGDISDKKAVRNEREKLSFVLKDNFPKANEALLITDVDKKSFVMFDVDTIVEGLTRPIDNTQHKT